MKHKLLIGWMVACWGLCGGKVSAAAVYYGPSPYQGRADSPFYQGILAGTIAVEDFNDEELNTPGVVGLSGAASPLYRDSVDEDDGVIDGRGLGLAWDPRAEFGPSDPLLFLDFRFSPDAEGRYPRYAGLVLVGLLNEGSGGTIPAVYDKDGNLVTDGRRLPVPERPGNDLLTIDDRFIGFFNADGISRMTFNYTARIDHLQFGYSIPEPGVAGSGILGLASLWLRRRRGASIWEAHLASL